ncbi:hypothetical protein PHMEG_00033528 [Phytophthora megakarya]|uniref:Ankyrin repeat-containing domain n=1 Tax=Phytophthora megakarya TaxID=4795 RepID=A0A225USW2_9STRA|nr:hypothetical protein PHMEG_00033528 [Phytophthora megakarya]
MLNSTTQSDQILKDGIKTVKWKTSLSYLFESLLGLCLRSCDRPQDVLLLIDEFLVDFSNQTPFNQACDHGESVKVLEFLLEQCLTDWKVAASKAAQNGHVYIFHWMKTMRQHCRDPSLNELEEVVIHAARSGYLEIVELLDKLGIRKVLGDAIKKAVEGGHLNVVKWLYNHVKNPPLVRLICAAVGVGHYAACDHAVDNGHLDVVQWLYENHYQRSSQRSKNRAAADGHMEVIKWLSTRHNVVCGEDIFSKISSLDVMKWMKRCMASITYFLVENEPWM